MKVKIGLVTFYSSVNYGAMLQAYALQRCLLSCGYECVIINYLTKAHEKEYMPDETVKKPRNDRRRYERFMRFMNQNMVLTREKYYTMKELEENFPEFDIYMTGSDQVWNLDFEEDVNLVYFLGMPGFKNRIAYGPSIGNCDPRKLCRVKNHLEKYQYIFPRENTTAEYLGKLLGRKIDAVIDPTLLLNRKEWKKLVRRKQSNVPYLFYYIAADDSYSFRMAKKVAKALGGLRIITVSYEKFYAGYHVYNCTSAGPIEFLNLIYNADFVFTTSFHGSVFSILLDVPFYTVCQFENDSRILDLLDALSLDGRMLLKDEKMTLSNEFLLQKPGVSDEKLEMISRDSRDKIQTAIKGVLST